jgi:hypothetical protein
VCVWICTDARAHTHAHTCIHTGAHTHIHTRTHTHTNTHTHVQVAVSSGGGNVHVLSVSEAALQESSTLQLGEEVACMDMTPFGACV